MGSLSKYDKNRAISIYENSREMTEEGVWVTRSRRYEEYSTARNYDDVIDAEVLPNNKRRNTQDYRRSGTPKEPEKVDNLTFMMMMNSLCMFFMLIVMFIRAVFSI